MRNRFAASLAVAALALLGCDAPLHSKPPERRTASTHPMQYYISLPANWSPARTWPVVVTIAGSGKEWEQNVATFAAERDKRRYPFIIVTPIVVTNGGREQRNNPRYQYASDVWDRVDREGRCTFDMDGIQAVVADVDKSFRGQSRPFFTGFSGGGQIAIALTYLRPDSLRAAAIAASNYNGRCITVPTETAGDTLPPQKISESPVRLTLPVRFFNGTADANAKNLIPQRDVAMRVAKEHGFGNVSFELVRNGEHRPMEKEVLAFFASLLSKDER